MTPVDDRAVQYDAREAVLAQYARAYEEHAVEEQLNRSKNPQLAYEHHDAVRIAIEGRMDEEAPPKPIQAPLMHCLECAFFYSRSGR